MYHTTSCRHTRMIYIEQTRSNLSYRSYLENCPLRMIWPYFAGVTKLMLAGYTASATLQSHTASYCYFHIW